MLAPYKDYVRAKEARDAGKEYEPLTSLESNTMVLLLSMIGSLREYAVIRVFV